MKSVTAAHTARARALRATGPYEDLAPATGAQNDTILVGNAWWIAPGHNAVVTDDAGTGWMAYHAFDAIRPGARMMLIDRIGYVKGWPSIAGRTPSTGMPPGPVFRR